MGLNGIRTTDLPAQGMVDSVIGNRDGSTSLIEMHTLVALLGAQIGLVIFKTLSEVVANDGTHTAGTYVTLSAGGGTLRAVDTGATITNAGSQGYVVENGPSFDTRDAAAAAECAGYPDGTLCYLAGLAYETDATATGTGSATNDLGINGLVPHGVVTVAHFGAAGVPTGGTPTDEAVLINRAIAYAAANGKREVSFGVGRDYRFDSQLQVQHPTDNLAVQVELTGVGVKLYSHVTGSIAGYDVAGFAILFDGNRKGGTGRGIELDFSNGTAGIAVRCRKHSSINNKWRHESAGGPDVTDRETATKISLRYIGNEAGASRTGNVVYYNTAEGGEWRNAYKHIEHVVGDGDASTRQPNGNNDLGCSFSRYIIAVDWGDTDENKSASWFNTANGVPGIMGGFTYCYKTEGSLNVASGSNMEPGPNSKPFLYGATASKNALDITSNCTHAGDSTSTTQDNTLFDRDKIVAVKSINHHPWTVAGAGDVNFFCNGVNSHAGTTRPSIKVGSQGGNTDVASIGWTTSANFTVALPAGNAFQISAGWETPVALTSAYLWSASGVPRWKNASLPGSASDGARILTADLPLSLPSLPVASLPAASAYPKSIVSCPDGNSGAECIAYSNGTTWLRIPLGAEVSAT